MSHLTVEEKAYDVQRWPALMLRPYHGDGITIVSLGEIVRLPNKAYTVAFNIVIEVSE